MSLEKELINNEQNIDKSNSIENKSQKLSENKEELKKENIEISEIKNEESSKKEFNENMQELNIHESILNPSKKDNKNRHKEEGGSLMITELFDIDNKKEENEKQIYLKQKFQQLETPLKMQKGIDLGMKLSLKQIHEKIINSKLKFGEKNNSFIEIVKKFKDIPKNNSINKSALLLSGSNDDKNTFKKNMKLYSFLKQNEEYLKKNIIKLEQNQKLYENISYPKENLVDNNINNFKLKNIINNKEILMKKLDRVSEQVKQVNNTFKDDKELNKKEKVKADFSTLEDYQEQYNKRLLKMEEKEKKMRLKYKTNIKLSYEKRQKELDDKAKQIIEEKIKNFKELKNKEKELFLKRKQKMDEIMEKSKKYIKEKSHKTENDYIFYKYQENYENSKNKLYNKIKMIKKDPLVSKEEIKELLNKIKEQKRLLLVDNLEKTKSLKKIWSCRSVTLPTYRSPLLDIIEKENYLRKQYLEKEKERKEYNELEKKNYKPPKSTISENLKNQREKRILMKNKDKIKETELHNKRRLNLKYSKVQSISPIIKKKTSQKSLNELVSNNYIDMKELNSFKQKKTAKILKPINILRKKPEKPKDYLSEILQKKSKLKRNSNSFLSIQNCKIKDLTTVESIMAVKDQINVMNDKLHKKQELLNVSEGYSNNSCLVNEVSDLLINSVKVKLNILSQIYK